ncbi:hypothetical protein [Peribacillus kribbensis]|uniref:hypothetical protein n=1 Tax=Peribacillus kribbensis TaxID=356658 RepID=UPI0003F5BAB3|nr:hypothetical protein [Peribacillus kribbensis]
MTEKIKHRTEMIVYHIQTNESIHLSEKTVYDVTSNIHAAVEELEEQIKKYQEENHALRWNELKIELGKRKFWKDPDHAGVYEELLALMERLDRRESIRTVH